jgi:endo-1,4-beta-xylanase
MIKNMKRFYQIALGLTVSAVLASCSDYEALDFHVDKPLNIADQELLDAYNPLKSYFDYTKYPDFKFGTAVSLSDYVNKKVIYRLANSNFDEITLGYEMKHAAVVGADGNLNLKNVESLLKVASEAGISIYGHTLAWHANQNATYLKKLIAPIIIPSSGGPTWDLVTSADFETDNASNYEYNANAVASFTAVGGGANGGRALKVTNSAVRTNDWEVQLFVKFSPAAVVGEKYILSMDIKADQSVTYPTQAHVTPGAYKHWDFFGTLAAGPTWSNYTKEITVTADMATCGAIAFNLGKNATNYYFDNITLKKYNPLGGSTTIEKTTAEKKALIAGAFDKFISEMVLGTKSYVKAWDVVNEPMDDGRPYELKTGVGRTNMASDEFYWQDYLGKDYAVEAFKLAKLHGNPTDKLFINDYNLEYSLDKCRGLIEYVAYIESKGAVVHGIGTQMHISTTSDKAKIVEMFRLLAATGKLIKISELDMGIAGKKTAEATEQDYKDQAELYKFVIDKYFEIIPANQRYGITIWSPLDSPANSSWRAGEPIGLWTEKFVRKPAYVGVAEALKGK